MKNLNIKIIGIVLQPKQCSILKNIHSNGWHRQSIKWRKQTNSEQSPNQPVQKVGETCLSKRGGRTMSTHKKIRKKKAQHQRKNQSAFPSEEPKPENTNCSKLDWSKTFTDENDRTDGKTCINHVRNAETCGCALTRNISGKCGLKNPRIGSRAVRRRPPGRCTGPSWRPSGSGSRRSCATHGRTPRRPRPGRGRVPGTSHSQNSNLCQKAAFVNNR